MPRYWITALLSAALFMHIACGGGDGDISSASGGSATPTPFDSGPETQRATPLGRGVNLGNMLEAPYEGAWGLTVQESDLALIKVKGFDTVRIPIRWSAHAGIAPLNLAPATVTGPVRPRSTSRASHHTHSAASRWIPTFTTWYPTTDVPPRR